MPDPVTTNRSSFWSLLLRVGLSVLLLGFLFTKVNWSELSDSMRDLHWGGYLLAILISVVTQTAGGLRWGGLGQAVGFTQSRLRFVQLYYEGMFFSLCLPSSIGGDVLKAYRLVSDNAGRILAACTIVTDRLAGLSALIVIGCTALATREYELQATGVILVGLGMIALFLVTSWTVLRLLGSVALRLKEDSLPRRFAERLLPYAHHPVVFWRAGAWSLFIQLLNVLAVSVLGWSIGIDIPLSAYSIAVPVIALFTALPISLNGVGVREGGLVWLLAPYGVVETQGVALGLLWLSTTIVMGALGGVVYMFGGSQPEKVVNDLNQPPHDDSAETDSQYRRCVPASAEV
ncbi:MAG: lysylphosphatidylglycerol synthase transmembrane domain-containing protein [Planctomycetota bacterium]|nr:lysylphosphatidylglycerol synthase transmembrane domain-containing protein [Planctomycetota bacterium]